MISLVHPSRGHITQFYGARQVDGNPHAGQDYAYSNWREIFPEVYAAADGVVLFAGDSRGLSWPNIMYLNPDFDRSDAQDSSAGNYTILGHYVGGVMIAMTGYGHQEEVWVRAGQAVAAGQRIGTVGETGFSAGKHLHFDFVLAPFVVNVAPYYGRVNPNGYFTTGTIYNLASGQLGTTTPKEWDEMASKEEVKAAMLEALEWKVDNTVGGKTSVMDVARIIDERFNKIPGTLLDEPVGRQGGAFPGVTSLRGVLAYSDQQHIEQLQAAASAARADGASVEQIIQAVRDALASGVKVTVEVAK